MAAIALKLVGQRFGRLLVAADFGRPRFGEWRTMSAFLCHCDCGNEVIVLGSNLQRNPRYPGTVSCGCHRAEVGKQLGEANKHNLKQFQDKR
jgi:hypothetical protein